MNENEREAKAMQREILRRMTGAQRLTIALEMTDLAREFTRAGIRARHPEWSERQVSRELLRIAFLPGRLSEGLQ
jgi:hypothetical protein